MNRLAPSMAANRCWCESVCVNEKSVNCTALRIKALYYMPAIYHLHRATVQRVNGSKRRGVPSATVRATLILAGFNRPWEAGKEKYRDGLPLVRSHKSPLWFRWMRCGVASVWVTFLYEIPPLFSLFQEALPYQHLVWLWAMFIFSSKHPFIKSGMGWNHVFSQTVIMP